MTVYEPGSVDDVARDQAKKLAKEGDAAFARACGEFARNDAFRSLNETIIANVGRDRDKGAMFARVPTGTETCTFCLMLASRGAVYHSRKIAGEWGRFHRGCDCKVVPSFEGDPDAELVQGVKPRELYERYKQFKEIDGYGLPRLQTDAVKAAACRASGSPAKIARLTPMFWMPPFQAPPKSSGLRGEPPLRTMRPSASCWAFLASNMESASLTLGRLG